MVIVGTANVGKTRTLNLVVGRRVGTESPIPGYEPRSLEVRLTDGLTRLRLYDLPWTTRDDTLGGGYVVTRIHQIRRRKFRSDRVVILEDSNKKRKPGRWSRGRMVLTLVLDLVNGFKRADEALLASLRTACPKLPVIVFVGKVDLLASRDAKRATERLLPLLREHGLLLDDVCFDEGQLKGRIRRYALGPAKAARLWPSSRARVW